MDTDRERLEVLLAIARKHHLSLDDLDDASRDMDCKAFTAWSQKVLGNVAANDGRRSA